MDRTPRPTSLAAALAVPLTPGARLRYQVPHQRDEFDIVALGTGRRWAEGRVTAVDHPDGRLSIRFRGVDLPYRTFDKLRQVDQGAIADNKPLGAALAFIREQQIERAEARSMKAPRRRDQREARLFKVG